MSDQSPLPRKPKLTASQQIEAMKSNGIRFELFSEERAEVFLTRRNYFFKLKAFCKNFDKWRSDDDTCGPYMSLDFAYLVELSKLDMRLRSFVLAASLDVEHFLKVRINEDVMENVGLDGYDVVRDFLAFDEDRKVAALRKRLSGDEVSNIAPQITSLAAAAFACEGTGRGEAPEAAIRALNGIRELVDGATGGVDLRHVEKSISYLGASSYSRKIANKYGDASSMAVWNFMELASFGDLISFYKYYFIERPAERKDRVARKVKPMLFPAKTLRNAAAHNSCLMHGMRDRLSAPVGAISKSLKDDYGIAAGTVSGTRRVPLVHDLSALLICYDNVVEGPGIRRDRARDMRSLRSRLTRNIDYFVKQPEIVAVISTLAELLEVFASVLEERLPSDIS